MTPSEAIRCLTTVAAARAWYRANGETLNSTQHLAFIVKVDALIKKESGDGGLTPSERP